MSAQSTGAGPGTAAGAGRPAVAPVSEREQASLSGVPMLVLGIALIGGGIALFTFHKPAEIWQSYAADIRGAKALPCGHYLSEEAPEETYNELRTFFRG